MTHQDVFLRAILDNPTDDASRRAYADWLQERDDPRGEFISLQYTLEQVEDETQRRQLRQRERELLAAHEKEWVGRLARLARRWQFRLGFVEAVEVDLSNFRRHGEELFRLAPLRRITLLPSAQGVSWRDCPWLERVESFDLRPLGGDPEEWAGLLRSPHLRTGRLDTLFVTVYLERPGRGEVLRTPLLEAVPCLHLDLDVNSPEVLGPLQDLPAPPGVRTLRVRARYRSGPWLQRMARCRFLAPITHLRLQACAVDAFGLEALAAATHWERLETLDLRENSIDTAGARALAGAPHLRSLRSLNLHNNSLGPQGIEALATSPHLGGLTELRLAWNRLGPEGAELIARSETFAGLAVLNLASNALGRAGAETLAGSPHLHRLRSLNLDNNRLGPRGVRALAALPLGRLEGLSLYMNQLGDSAVAALAGNPDLTRLAVLNLSGNTVADDGARALADSPHLTSLTRLFLNGNAITDLGAEALLASPRLAELRQLRIDGNRLSGPMTARMRDRFGDARPTPTLEPDDDLDE